MTKQLVLSCDASNHGISAVLAHLNSVGSEAPIAYASCTLTSAERNYRKYGGERRTSLYFWSHPKFHQYLYGQRFSLVSDNKPLMSLYSESKGIPQMASGRIHRWALTLLVYDYEIKYHQGKLNFGADSTSTVGYRS